MYLSFQSLTSICIFNYFFSSLLNFILFLLLIYIFFTLRTQRIRNSRFGNCVVSLFIKNGDAPKRYALNWWFNTMFLKPTASTFYRNNTETQRKVKKWNNLFLSFFCDTMNLNEVKVAYCPAKARQWINISQKRFIWDVPG